MTSQDKKILIIYHNEDADGLLSAAICWNAILGNDKYKLKDYILYNTGDEFNLDSYASDFCVNNNLYEIELLGTTYAELSALIDKYGSYTNLVDSWSEKYSQIIMTDISFNETKAMKYLYDKFDSNFVWLDHHAPIIEASYKEGFANICGTRDSCCSAIMHAWKYFYGGLPIQFEMNLDDDYIPWLVRVLSGYDSFNWPAHGIDFDTAFQATRGFEFYIKKDIAKTIDFATNLIVDYLLNKELNYDSEIIRLLNDNQNIADMITDYHDFFETDIDNIKFYGKTICEYEEYKWENTIESSGDFEWTLDGKYAGKRKAVALFTQGHSCSTYFKSLKKTHPDIQNAIVFKKNPHNDGWSVSVYNINVEDDKTYNVGNYLKKRYKKGGGHAGAGGATISKNQFARIMKTKSI